MTDTQGKVFPLWEHCIDTFIQVKESITQHPFLWLYGTLQMKPYNSRWYTATAITLRFALLQIRYEESVQYEEENDSVIMIALTSCTCGSLTSSEDPDIIVRETH